MIAKFFQAGVGTREVNLLPCPLCQDDVEQDLDKFVLCDPNDMDEEQAEGTWGVRCGCCGITLAGYDTPEQAVTRWNGREPGRGWQ